MTAMAKTKIFHDPIHGTIELPELCVKIIDTPQFQRLRYIRQLGSCYFVYPGASHNRFEHSLGACHLAGELVKSLQSQKEPELGITEKDVLCVEIAGLCHDLGHGPFSHMFDNKFIPATNQNATNWSHEVASQWIFDHLISDNKLEKDFDDALLNEKYRTFIKELITGEKKEGHPDGKEEKTFLYQIIANKATEIDVDKWDYFARDCHHLGIKNGFDHGRFIKFARALEVPVPGSKVKEWRICTRDKEVTNLYDMFYTRDKLHRRAYQHKVSCIIDEMIIDAMVKANDFIPIPNGPSKTVKMSQCVDGADKVAAYCTLTDTIYHRILFSTDTHLESSRCILQRIERRELYPCVYDEKLQEEKKWTTEEIADKKKKIIELDETAELNQGDLLIKIVTFNYGMKDKDPITTVPFYKKRDIMKAYYIDKKDISNMLPAVFQEFRVRIYCKKHVAKVRRAVEQAIKKRILS